MSEKPKYFIKNKDGEFVEIKGIPEITEFVSEEAKKQADEKLFDMLYNAQLSRGIEAKA